MRNNKDELAFPRSEAYQCSGMTLRDYLAAKAMPMAAEQEAQFSKSPSYAGTAQRAYQFADAMLVARQS